MLDDYGDTTDHNAETKALKDQVDPALMDEDAAWVKQHRTAAPVAATATTGDGPALISRQQLADIWNYSPSLIKAEEVIELNACLHEFGMAIKPRLRHFLSQIAHESGGGRLFQERTGVWSGL